MCLLFPTLGTMLLPISGFRYCNDLCILGPESGTTGRRGLVGVGVSL